MAYRFLCESVPILLGRSSSNFLHRGSPNIKTFEGKLACGACCYMLHYYLEERGLNTKMMIKKRGREDHCFLLASDFIIDPTYRQFIHPSKWYPSFIFVGSHRVLEKHCRVEFWENASISPEPMDARQVLTNRQYAIKRGDYFTQLHDFFNKK